jgi:tetratricopeptide (TPR) repeat protein
VADIYYYYYHYYFAIRAWRGVYYYFFPFAAERGEHFFSYGVLLDARMKQLKSAEVMYGRAIELAPQHVGALVNLGNLLASVRNDTDGAHALYARAHALEPQSAGILNNMALLLHRKALHAHSRFSLCSRFSGRGFCFGEAEV